MAVNSDQPLGYTNYSFTSLVLQLQNNLIANQSAWRDMYRSGTGQMLIELFAAVGTLVNYYIERRAEETYLPTAQNYSSVVNLVSLIDYQPSRNVSSTGNIQITLSAPTINPVYVPIYTSASTSTGVNFVTTTNSVLQANQTTVVCPAIQGTLVNVTWTSNGAANQVFNINDTTVENSIQLELITTTTVLNIANTLQGLFSNSFIIVNADGSYSVWAPTNPSRPQTLFVSINGIQWQGVNSFANSVSTSNQYVVQPQLNGTISILFGDGVYGAVPPNGASILITYISSGGLSGNVYVTPPTSGGITVLNSSLYDSQGNLQTATVVNTTVFLGGENAETTAEIKAKAPQVFATGDRAVTPADFQALILNFPGVAAVNVFGENENNPPNYNMFNQVQFCIVLQNWGIPSAAYEAALAQYLYFKALTTVRYSFISPVILQVVPVLYIKLVQGSPISQLQGDIEAAVQSLFVLGSTTTLGNPIYQAGVIDAIENISGVVNCHVTLTIQKTLLTGYNSSYTYATNMDALPVLPGSVQLYVGTTLAAVDNGLGTGWTGKNGYTAIGVVNYTTTGFVGVNSLSPAPGVSSVTILYQQNNLGDIAPTQNQICEYISNSAVYTNLSY